MAKATSPASGIGAPEPACASRASGEWASVRKCSCIAGGIVPPPASAFILAMETLTEPAKNVTPKMRMNGTACESMRARGRPKARIIPKEKRPSTQVTTTASANQTA